MIVEVDYVLNLKMSFFDIEMFGQSFCVVPSSSSSMIKFRVFLSRFLLNWFAVSTRSVKAAEDNY